MYSSKMLHALFLNCKRIHEKNLKKNLLFDFYTLVPVKRIEFV